jgi:hypothetical protein
VLKAEVAPDPDVPPAGASADELYEFLVSAVDAHHEQHFFDAVDRLGKDVAPADLVRLLRRALTSQESSNEAPDGWNTFWALKSAVAWAFVLHGIEGLRVLADSADREDPQGANEGLGSCAAWVAISYPKALLSEARAVASASPSVQAWVRRADEGGYWSYFDRDFYAEPEGPIRPPGFEDRWEPYAVPLPFAAVAEFWQATVGPRDQHQWYAPEGRVELDIPWEQSRYNPKTWTITASSSAPGHGTEALIDGDVATYWCADPADRAPTIEFVAPERLSVWYNVGCCGLLVMVPGAAGSLDDFLAAGRPTKVRMEYGDGTYRDSPIPYGESGNARTYLFEPKVKWEHVSDRFTIRFLEWKPGTQLTSPALSELGCEPSPQQECGDGMSPIVLE